MNNDFIWEDDVNFCGIVVRLAIVKFDDSNLYGACIAQIFEDEFVMVEAAVFNNVNAAKNFLFENVIAANLFKLESMKDNLARV